jgi:hypothetical protein
MYLIRMYRVLLIIEITEDNVKVKVTVVDTIILIQMLTEGDPIESSLKRVCFSTTGLTRMILITRMQKRTGVTFAGTVGTPGTIRGIAPIIDTSRTCICFFKML